MRRWLAVGSAGLALVAGCATAPPPPAGPQGPKVYRHIENERWFSLPTRCGQGPYEIEMTTIGGRWEEEIELQVESRQRVRVTGAILVDDVEVAKITRTLGFNNGDGPENQYCVATAADVAQAMRQPSAAGGASSTGPGAPVVAGGELPAAPAAVLLPVQPPPNGGYHLVDWTAGESSARRKGGQRVRIRLWSDVPNDFEGARIGARQMVTRPDDDAAYDASVVERARWEREEAARRLAARTPAEEAADRKRADELAAKRLEAERAFRAHCQAQPDDSPCLSQAERVARAAKRSPDAPPPTRAEAAVPRPSQNAEWRPGYWHHAGVDWIWIAGTWRVPEEDVRAGRTVHAPAAPPAPPPEAMPVAPAPSTVWMPGFWQWTGSAWMWVAGSWQLPPTANLRWQPPRWINRGGVFVFVPGGWIGAGRP